MLLHACNKLTDTLYVGYPAPSAPTVSASTTTACRANVLQASGRSHCAACPNTTAKPSPPQLFTLHPDGTRRRPFPRGLSRGYPLSWRCRQYYPPNARHVDPACRAATCADLLVRSRPAAYGTIRPQRGVLCAINDGSPCACSSPTGARADGGSNRGAAFRRAAPILCQSDCSSTHVWPHQRSGFCQSNCDGVAESTHCNWFFFRVTDVSRKRTPFSRYGELDWEG